MEEIMILLMFVGLPFAIQLVFYAIGWLIEGGNQWQ